MVIKFTETDGIQIAEFTEVNRFTLAVTEEVRNQLKPILSSEGAKLIIDFRNIEFIDSSGIGCIISLVKTAKSNGAKIKLCSLCPGVMEVFELLHLQMILEIEKDTENCISSQP